MRFPLKLALSSVLAKPIAAELTHMAQTQQIPNELDIKSQSQQQPQFREQVQTDLPEDAVKSAYPGFPGSMQVPVSLNANQYGTPYNAENDGIQADTSNQYPTYIDSSLPYNGYAGVVPYVPAQSYRSAGPVQDYNNQGAFNVQAGYDGYLVAGPPPAKVAPVAKTEAAPSFLAPITNAFSALRSFPGNPFSSIINFVSFAFGGGFFTLLCTFTPLCTITFPFLPIRGGLKFLAKTYAGEENAELLDKAIGKFANMQPDEQAKAAAKSGVPLADSDLKDEARIDTSAPVPVSAPVPAPAPLSAPAVEAPKNAEVEKSANDSITK